MTRKYELSEWAGGDGSKAKAMGARIREIRDGLEETQVAFAARLETTSGTVSRWENGRRVPLGGLVRRFLLRWEAEMMEGRKRK